MENSTKREIKMLPGEKWWGLCCAFGREMPFTETSDFTCDLRKDNYGHQSLSLLCSDKGRAIWCPEPVGVTIAGGSIHMESDGSGILLDGQGDDLLVAPVLAKGGAERSVALPPGRWRDDLGAIHEGPATLVLEEVPISRLPHYERL